jgi:hypothetical protein
VLALLPAVEEEGELLSEGTDLLADVHYIVAPC